MAQEKRSGKRTPSPRTSSRLKDQRRKGKVLKSRLAQLPLIAMSWARNSAPDYLWLDAVLAKYPQSKAIGIMYGVLDLFDEFVSEQSVGQDFVRVLDGRLSSLDLVPQESRDAALDRLYDDGVFDDAFPIPLRHALALYPECPANWLLSRWAKNTRIDADQGLEHLTEALLRLFMSQEAHATQCRLVSIARLLKHRRISVPPDPELRDLITKYPAGLNEDEQARAESWIRACHLSIYGPVAVPIWIPSFWRHCYDLSPCIIPDDEDELPNRDKIHAMVIKVADVVKNFTPKLYEATAQAKTDVYAPDRDDVLFGLLSRQYRLFVNIAVDPNNWSPELGNATLRMMADLHTTLSWLLKRNDMALFRRFKDYGLGKQKLHMMHLTDIAQEKGLDLDHLIDDLASGISKEQWEEAVVVDFGQVFENTSIRTMAEEVGQTRLYNLLYAPASTAIHGEWSNLKDHYLQRCMNPLHLFHWLPQLDLIRDPRSETIVRAVHILVRSLRVWANHCGLDSFAEEIDGLIASVENLFEITVGERDRMLYFLD